MPNLRGFQKAQKHKRRYETLGLFGATTGNALSS